MDIRVIPSADYWKLREPYDRYLPDSISDDEVAAELAEMETRFRAESAGLGEEGTDWSFPGHYQHVRVFYIYVLSPQLVQPLLAQAIQKAMAGFEDSWIGEIECYEEPDEGGSMSIIVYLHRSFVFEDDKLSQRFAAALQPAAP